MFFCKSAGNKSKFIFKLFATFAKLYLFYQGPNVSRAMVFTPPCQEVTNISQTDKNNHIPARPKAGNPKECDESHILQALWSRKDI